MALSWLMMIVLLLLPKQLRSQLDTTVFNYTIFGGNEADLTYRGDAHVRPGLTYINLIAIDDRTTPPQALRKRVGRVVYSPPIRLWDRAGRRQANFQTVIRGSFGNNFRYPIGDGIAFFIAPVNTTNTIPVNSDEGNLGLYTPSGDSPTPLFSVELDVFSNAWDPSYGHVGININSRRSVAVARWDLLNNGRDVEARLTYVARERMITAVASASPTNPGGQPVTATVGHAFDLKTLLPEWVQIGISASTALEQAARHEIHGWSFISFMDTDDDDNNVDHDRTDDALVQNA